MVLAQDVSLLDICLLLSASSHSSSSLTWPFIALFPFQGPLEHSSLSLVNQLLCILGLLSCSQLHPHCKTSSALDWLTVWWCLNCTTPSMQRYSALLSLSPPHLSAPSFLYFFPPTSSVQPLSWPNCPVLAFYQNPTWLLSPCLQLICYRRKIIYPDFVKRWSTLGFLHLYSSSQIGLWFFFSLCYLS